MQENLVDLFDIEESESEINEEQAKELRLEYFVDLLKSKVGENTEIIFPSYYEQEYSVEEDEKVNTDNEDEIDNMISDVKIGEKEIMESTIIEG